jgi:primosomal protein N' (replication factor Y)
MRKGRITEKQVEFINLLDNIDINGIYASIKKSAKNQLAILDYMQDRRCVRASLLRQEFGSSSVKALIDRGVLGITKIRVNRLPYSEMLIEDKSVVLTPAQNNAISSINSTNKEVTLIHGVTGSGKTEVYLQLIKQAIQDGKTAIM